jgi:cold shock CspA family protein
MGRRGFGFIQDDAGGEVTFDGAAVEGAGFAALRTGQRVRFVREMDPRGRRDAAIAVERVHEAP